MKDLTIPTAGRTEAAAPESFLSDTEKIKRLAGLLRSLDVAVFEYFPGRDLLVTYDSQLKINWQCASYLTGLEQHSRLFPEDRPRIKQLLTGRLAQAELSIFGADGGVKHFLFTTVSPREAVSNSIIGAIRNVTLEKEREKILKDTAQRDSLTRLYNSTHGRKLVNEYLRSRNPFVSCALLIIDIDFFKNVNDVYGHLFGDMVLTDLAEILMRSFGPQDILMRVGGDEFVAFLKDIPHSALIRKTNVLMDAIRNLSFRENDCRITCSVGVCFLSENSSGYTWQQLFADADWALYRAKEFGRNRCEFCDSLERYEQATVQDDRQASEIDERWLHNDIVSTAFEIFEKAGSFDSAIHLLLKIIGIRFQLDRITVIRTDTRERASSRQYQWTAPGIEEALPVKTSFTKADFLTLFHSYDSHGTTVLNYDDMSMYSQNAQKLLMQGNAKTVVYAAMYCEGKYTGAISYVTCGSKRHWSENQRSRLGELTKLISAHLAKSLAINASLQGIFSAPGYDSLTGLISFSHFREETERVILGETGGSHAMVYSDFENFKYMNQKYGYRKGDQLLKDFTNYLMDVLSADMDVYLTRVVADQFIMFSPVQDKDSFIQRVSQVNERFILVHTPVFPDVNLRIRSGIYFITPDCVSSSAAIDAANFARRQVRYGALSSVRVYDRNQDVLQTKETELMDDMRRALKLHEFQVYLQPKFMLSDCTIVGAEALVRWKKPDGTILLPDTFIPLYERSGRISDLDFYVFEEVAAFLAKNNRLGRRQVPISINASILHASDSHTVQRYLEILKKYGVDPALTEIELTETATVSDYDSVVSLFREFQNVNFLTSLDDFGAGYSILNAVVDIPVNTVKIDRLFLNHCETSQKGIYFLKHIIAMVRGLGYRVLCEGIETEQQRLLLLEAGCDEGQGFWFSRPLPIAEYEKLMYGEQE